MSSGPPKPRWILTPAVTHLSWVCASLWIGQLRDAVTARLHFSLISGRGTGSKGMIVLAVIFLSLSKRHAERSLSEGFPDMGTPCVRHLGSSPLSHQASRPEKFILCPRTLNVHSRPPSLAGSFIPCYSVSQPPLPAVRVCLCVRMCVRCPLPLPEMPATHMASGYAEGPGL